jgi:hypothetical protein
MTIKEARQVVMALGDHNHEGRKSNIDGAR